MNDRVSSIGTWIPQFFYDIIGRIVPGFLILLSFAIAIQGPVDFWRSFNTFVAPPSDMHVPSATLVLVIGTCCSYGIAVVLAGFGFLLPDFLGRDFAKQFDFVKKHDLAAGLRIAKMNAEDHMLRVMIVGWMLVFLVSLQRFMIAATVERGILMLALVVGVVSLFLWLRTLSNRRQGAVDNYSAMLELPHRDVAHPKATVAAIIRRPNGTKILLTKRMCLPYANRWCLPGGHIEPDELAVDAIRREVFEETGLTVGPEFCFYADEVLHDCSPPIHAVVLVFEATATEEVKIDRKEVSDAKWFTPTEAARQDLAFKHNDIFAKYALTVAKTGVTKTANRTRAKKTAKKKLK